MRISLGIVMLVLLAGLTQAGLVAGQGLTPEDQKARHKQAERTQERVVEHEKDAYQSVYGVLGEPETAQMMADYAKNLFEALRARGFSSTDALRLTANLPLPVPPGPTSAQ